MALSIRASRVKTSSAYIAAFPLFFAKFSAAAKDILIICEICDFVKAVSITRERC